MKKPIILFILFLNLTACLSDAEFPESHPFLVTNQVSFFDNSQGVRFSAKIISLGTEKIKDYGFEWFYKSKTIKSSAFETGKPTGFSLVLTTNFERNESNYCRAYILTDMHTVYSNWVIID